MDKLTIFEIIAGVWSTGVIILVGAMLNSIRGEINSLHNTVRYNFERINGRLTKAEDRIYDLNITKRGDHGPKRSSKVCG